MIGMFTFVVLEIVRVWSSVVIWARVLRNTPAAISNISDSFCRVGLRFITFNLKSKLSMMSMMLKSSSKLARIEKRSPMLQSLINNKPIILK